MDKNTLLGLLLMGGVILGFMWLNQPSAEELERRRQEAAEQLAAQQQANKQAEQQNVLIVDSLTPTEEALITPTIKQYGEADAQNPEVYTLSNGTVELRLEGGAVSGKIAVNDTTVAVAQVLSGDLASYEPRVASMAVKALKDVVSQYGRYQEFARFLTGAASDLTLENDLIALNLNTKGGKIARAELKQYLSYDSANVVLFDDAHSDFNFTLTTINQRLETRDLYFKPIVESDSSVLMSLDFASGASFGIRYTLPADSYVVKIDVVQNGMQNIIPTSTSTIDVHWYQQMSRHEEGKTFEERNSAICRR